MTNRPIVMLPGLGGSGENHWQSIWERSLPGARRINPGSWDHPELGNWLDALDTAIDAASNPPILVAHNLSCLLVAHWAERRRRAQRVIAGAFLVAIPDPGSATFPGAARSFGNLPIARLPFPTLVVCSQTDPFASVDFSRNISRQWDARQVALGELGHINTESGHGKWPDGAALLSDFAARLPLKHW